MTRAGPSCARPSVAMQVTDFAGRYNQEADHDAKTGANIKTGN